MNLFSLPLLPISEELTDILARSGNIRIERIVSTGQTSGWYNQEESEFVALLKGTARLEFEDGEITELNAGDTLVIPQATRHRVAYTSSEPPCIWLCVFWR